MSSKFLIAACAALVLSACASDDVEDAPTTMSAPNPVVSEAPKQPAAQPAQPAEASSDTGVFGWMSGGSSSSDERKGVAVNAYLWRASLDTLSFMPMDQADPFGGTIKTGWYIAPSAPNERMRVAVYILDSRLRADALRLSLFKEVKKPTGDWIDAASDPETVTKLENLILNKARALKIQDGG